MLVVLSVVMAVAIISGFLMLWEIPEAAQKRKAKAIDKTISVIIPARNEASNLPKLLSSLKTQQLQPIEIIVVDDHSEDQTAQIAQQYGAQVLHPISEADGEWSGKSAACWKGAQAAEGDWLLFLDADTQFEESTSFERLVATYESAGTSGILSFQPFHQIEKGYENLSVVFNIILIAGMNVFTPLGRKIPAAGSFGPCILVDKAEYFLTDGHKAVSDAIMDDLAIGENFRKHRLPVRCYSGRKMIQFRMYPEGLHQLIEGWTKGFGTAAQSTHLGVTALISLWISGAFVSTGGLLVSLFLGQAMPVVVSFIFCVIYMVQFYWQARRIGNFHFLVALFYPLLFLFFVALFMRSLFFTKILRKVKWRGRDIEV